MRSTIMVKGGSHSMLTGYRPCLVVTWVTDSAGSSLQAIQNSLSKRLCQSSCRSLGTALHLDLSAQIAAPDMQRMPQTTTDFVDVRIAAASRCSKGVILGSRAGSRPS